MEENKEQEELKISVPLYTNQELSEMENIIQNDLESIFDKVSKHVYHDRELIALQKIIEKQQKELNKEKEKNKKYENKIKAVLELIDTKPYTAYTLYGDILYDDENIRELLEERKD